MPIERIKLTVKDAKGKQYSNRVNMNAHKMNTFRFLLFILMCVHFVDYVHLDTEIPPTEEPGNLISILSPLPSIHFHQQSHFRFEMKISLLMVFHAAYHQLSLWLCDVYLAEQFMDGKHVPFET